MDSRAVALKRFIRGQQRQGFGNGLGDEQPIKRVPVIWKCRKLTHSENVLVSDREPLKTHLGYLPSENVRVDGELAQLLLYYQFPQRDAAHANFIGGVNDCLHMICDAPVARLPPEGNMGVE
jgi:hypothetical protein